jgi:hypothetical protein
MCDSGGALFAVFCALIEGLPFTRDDRAMSFPSADEFRRQAAAKARQADVEARSARQAEHIRQAAVLEIIREYLMRQRELGFKPVEVRGSYSSTEQVVRAEGYYVGGRRPRCTSVYAAVPGCRYWVGHRYERWFSSHPGWKEREETVERLTFFIYTDTSRDNMDSYSLRVAASTEEALANVAGTPDEVRASLVARISHQLTHPG